MANPNDDFDQASADEFASAFNDEAGPSAGGDDFGAMPGEEAQSETAAPVADAAPAVVIVAEVKPDPVAAEQAANDAGQADASAVAKDFEEKAEAQAGETDATREAAAQSKESGAEPDADDPLADVPPEDLQKAKSWMGRLKAEEKRLAALRAEIEAAKGSASPSTTQADPTHQPTNDEATEAAQEVAQAAQSGDAALDEVLARLESDFGPEFVQAVRMVAASQAGKLVDEKVGAVNSQFDQLMNSVKSDAEAAHYEAIHDAHNDFLEIGASPEFDAYKKANPQAAHIAEKGSARQINKMLTQYKAELKAKSQPDTALADAADAAGAVRSRGIVVPDKPARPADQDFASAWDSF